jgi:hypothetical protein
MLPESAILVSCRVATTKISWPGEAMCYKCYTEFHVSKFLQFLKNGVHYSKTYTIDVQGSMKTVSFDRLKPLYVLHVDTESASPPALPSGVTTRSGRRVRFPDYLGVQRSQRGSATHFDCACIVCIVYRVIEHSCLQCHIVIQVFQ